jgi:hypothetical protein
VPPRSHPSLVDEFGSEQNPSSKRRAMTGLEMVRLIRTWVFVEAVRKKSGRFVSVGRSASGPCQAGLPWGFAMPDLTPFRMSQTFTG